MRVEQLVSVITNLYQELSKVTQGNGELNLKLSTAHSACYEDNGDPQT